MVGYISESVAAAARSWATLKDANVFPVRANAGDSTVVDTPLPAVAIHIIGDDGAGNVYIGGGIRQYFELQLYCLLPVTNYTFSRDGGTTAKMLDISDEVLRCIEQSDLLNEVKQKYDWNIQYDRMATETTYGTKGSISVLVDVHKLIFKCDVEFDQKIDPSKLYAILERVEITEEETNIKSILE